ncbi:MAG: hypothetical protein AAGI46_08295 [Planctomycetota bacterium]
MSKPTFDTAAAHRWFAVEANNRAWDLIEQERRTPVEERELLDAAHASSHHWTHVGQPINELRSLVLLAAAHHGVGDTRQALRFAGLAVAKIDDVGEAATPFDRAIAFRGLAVLASAAGDDDVARQAREQFEIAIVALKGADDVEMVRKMFR